MTNPPVDVLIVGAGPTGLAMGLELALHNVSFRIVEKSTVPSDKSRALILHPRSLELLRRHGITEDITRLSTKGLGGRVFVNKKQVAEIDLTDLGLGQTAFTRPEWISQAETEAIMALHLASVYGVKIERGVEAEHMEQDATGVSVTISKDGHTEELRCSFVVGCDGAHSVVRRAAELPFEGAPYQQGFMLCDTQLRWNNVQPGEIQPLMFFMGNEGIMVIFPFKDGSVRIVGTLTVDTDGNGDGESEPTLQDFQSLFDSMAPGTGELNDPIWIAKFKLHHRGVPNYRNGRLFVAGDAAHIHSPAGGQGMNTGIQDAVNLGWKIARVLSRENKPGEVNERLLNSYNEERHPVGQHLLKGTDRLFGFMSSRNYLWLIWRNFFATWILPWIVSSRERRAKAFRFITQLGIRYRRSPIVGTSEGFTGLVKGGDRAPDGKCKTPAGEEKFLLDLCRGDRFYLILFAGCGARMETPENLKSIATRFATSLATKDLDKIEVHKVYSFNVEDETGILDLNGELHTAYGFDKPGYVLVRPDAYIAHIGWQSSMDKLLEWLEATY